MDCHHLDFTFNSSGKQKTCCCFNATQQAAPQKKRLRFLEQERRGQKVSRSMKEAWSKIERMKEADLRWMVRKPGSHLRENFLFVLSFKECAHNAMKVLDLTSIESPGRVASTWSPFLSPVTVWVLHIFQILILSKLKLFHSFELLNKVIAFVWHMFQNRSNLTPI